ncbi:MAG: thioredoxin [Acidiferrobacterales bacterium]|nr:thioredoxin [Acidiferrobacterales bacterium]
MFRIGGDEFAARDPGAIDVDAGNFLAEVIEKSNTVPVLVDFWAPWCEPCKTLTPILEEVSAEYGDNLHFVKINIDENQALAGQFGIRSVPTVYLVKNSDVVDGFMGALPKEAIRQFLSKHVVADNAEEEDPIDELLSHGDKSRAIAQLKSEDSDEANLRLAGIYLQDDDYQSARDYLSKVKDDTASPEYRKVVAKLEIVDIVENASPQAELQARIAQDPEDWDAQFHLAAINLLQGHFETALESLLEIVRKNRSFNDDAGRKTLVKAFDMLGPDDDLVSKYRRMLARTLN